MREVTLADRGQFLLDYIDLLMNERVREPEGFRHGVAAHSQPAPRTSHDKWVINKVRALGSWYTKGLDNGSHLRTAINSADSLAACATHSQHFSVPRRSDAAAAATALPCLLVCALVAGACGQSAADNAPRARLRQDHRPPPDAEVRLRRRREVRHGQLHGRRRRSPHRNRQRRGRQGRSLGVLRRRSEAREDRFFARKRREGRRLVVCRAGRDDDARRDVHTPQRQGGSRSSTTRRDRLVRAEEDTDGDGAIDKWETYDGERLASVAFDTEHRGTPDRRLIYGADGSARLEVDAAGDGHFAPVQAPGDPKATGPFRTPVKPILYIGCPQPERAATEKILAGAGMSIVWADNGNTRAQRVAAVRDAGARRSVARRGRAAGGARPPRPAARLSCCSRWSTIKRPDLTAEAVLTGVADVFARPPAARRLVNALEREKSYESRQSARTLEIAGDALYSHSPSMREVVTLIARAASVKTGVTIRGEEGTGRQVVARAIHAAQHEGAAPFVSVDCAAHESDRDRRRALRQQPAIATRGEQLGPRTNQPELPSPRRAGRHVVPPERGRGADARAERGWPGCCATGRRRWPKRARRCGSTCG